ncbi:MAG: YidC/Oxa1 family membrane protein insertase [Oscillospiraceae bacterium]|nr:YidC/Oxa1 family membrane protein insertase [Oscillospiraceae bacterium]
MDLMYYIVFPFSWLLNIFNSVFNSYGLAIILFGLVVKIILFPLSLKGKKSMIQTSMLSAKLEQLKKQYGKDQQRYNMEMQKLYQKEGVNPMGGCLWSLLPIFVLLPLYAIIREPLKYLMGLTPEQIQQVADALNWGTVAFERGWIGEVATEFVSRGYEQLYLASLITAENLPLLAAKLGESVNIFIMNFSFLGVDLATMPTWKIWADPSWNTIGAFLLVMVSTGLSVLMSKVSMMTNKMSGHAADAQSEKTARTMMWTMPLMSLWIGFSMPAALCVYWIANSLFSMLQELLASKMLKKDYEKARLAAEERARQEKEEEKTRKETARLERARRAKEDKKGTVPEGVNKDDSREGLRAYARGRAYIPNRYGEVTEYVDPNTMTPVDAKTRKEQEKSALAAQQVNVTEKMDLTGLGKQADEPVSNEDKESV